MWVTVKKEITKEEKPSAVITLKEEKANVIMSLCERHRFPIVMLYAQSQLRGLLIQPDVSLSNRHAVKFTP